MALKRDYFLSCIFFLLFLNSFPCSSHPNSPHAPGTSQDATPLGYLHNMVGARKGNRANGVSQLKKYLSNLGYMDANFNSANPANVDLFDDNLESALRKYQKFFKLNISGTLDSQTVTKLMSPRCGVPDLVLNHKKDQSKNWTNLDNMGSLFSFFPGNPKWPPTKQTLTYEFQPGTRSDVVRPIMAALAEWAQVTGFNFVHIPYYDRADIKISFQVRDHGDGYPFDGRYGVLAHAFAPTDGRLHYDGDEHWVDGVVPDFLDLQTVGLHELGHILGLGHSADPGAIMYPYIGPGVRRGLGQDDINGIYVLYRR